MVPYTRLLWRQPNAADNVRSSDLPSSENRHDTGAGMKDSRVSQYDRESESCYDEYGGNESSKVNRARCLIAGVFIRATVRKESIWQWCKHESESWKRLSGKKVGSG